MHDLQLAFTISAPSAASAYRFETLSADLNLILELKPILDKPVLLSVSPAAQKDTLTPWESTDPLANTSSILSSRSS